MKILYVCRLFSGFEESIKTGVWSPTGAPTIARMIEHLDQNDAYDLHWLMTCKDFNLGWQKERDEICPLEGLSSAPLVLTGRNYYPRWLGKFREKLSDLRQLWLIYRYCRKVQPDLVYFDRVNILPAAFLARFTKWPVMWRVMGVLSDMHEKAQSTGLRARWMQLLWRSPFASIICTLDGSGGGPWMEKTLSADVPRHLLLNGFNHDLVAEKPKAYDLDAQSLKVLFVGRLEGLKGVDEFLDAAFDVLERNEKYKVCFVGDGSARQALEKRVKEAGFSEGIIFFGALKPEEVKYVRQKADIYVSLNKQGNLSNVNLEAMADGLAVLIPSSSPEIGIDVDTDDLIPADVFYRYGAVGDKQALVDALQIFADDKIRKDYSRRAQDKAQEILKSWDERIDQELAIFDQCVRQSNEEA